MGVTLAVAAVMTWSSLVPMQLVRPPYLQSATPDSVVVVWESAAAADGRVTAGTSVGAQPLSATDSAVTARHAVRLGGLTPNTRYFYSVGSTAQAWEGPDDTHVFTTPPVTGTALPFRAWVLGDSGTGNANQDRVRDAMLTALGPDLPQLFLHVGDMAYNDGTTAQFTGRFFAPYAGILRRTLLWTALGNHEGHTSDSATESGPYYEAYVLPRAGEAGGLPSGTEAYYAFDHANVHFVVLDSYESPRTTGGAMLTWLQSDLAATTQPWIIAMWHHPAYTKGSHNSDTETELIQMRENALPILEAAGVDLVLTGHSHIYERSLLVDGAYDTPTTAAGHLKDARHGRPDGVGPYVKPAGVTARSGTVHVVAGHGGAGLGQSAVHPLMAFTEMRWGSAVLDVDGNHVVLFNIREDGAITDRVALVKGDGLVLAHPVGGETLLAGGETDIRWSTAGTIARVALDWSDDDGASWRPLVTDLLNTGRWHWALPRTPTSQGRVRVRSATDSAVRDVSHGRFTLADGAVTLAAIPHGSPWRYHVDGTDPGSTWKDPAHDDGSWAEGPAQLGYGDGDEATRFSATTPAQPSVYFRRTLHVGRRVTAANATATYDDAMGLWVNGTLVDSVGMTNGTGHAAYGGTTSADNATWNVAIPPALFVEGDNVIAVMVKQANGTSSDMSFDLRLDLAVDALPPLPDAGAAPTSSSSAGASSSAAPATSTAANTSLPAPSSALLASSSTASSAAAGTSAAVSAVSGGNTGDAPPRGCGCMAGTSRPGWMLLGLAGLLALRRRRCASAQKLEERCR
ncbi:MAG: metallophosphoesterase [Deltaproteobacteria bacterium]|nr:metallophosphoesterase [Deltaproteobacteria bacterium]